MFSYEKANIKYLGSAKSCQDLKLNYKLSKQFNRDFRLEKKRVLYFTSLRDRVTQRWGREGKEKGEGIGERRKGALSLRLPHRPYLYGLL